MIEPGTMELRDQPTSNTVAVDFRSSNGNVVIAVHSERPIHIDHEQSAELGTLLMAMSTDEDYDGMVAMLKQHGATSDDLTRLATRLTRLSIVLKQHVWMNQHRSKGT